jgi:hypothetical protein
MGQPPPFLECVVRLFIAWCGCVASPITSLLLYSSVVPLFVLSATSYPTLICFLIQNKNKYFIFELACDLKAPRTASAQLAGLFVEGGPACAL